MRRILYVQHCGGIGGAPLSLLFLIRKLDKARYQPLVLFLEDGEAVDLFRAEGIETYVRPDISCFEHVEGSWYSVAGPRPWRVVTQVLRLLPSVAKSYALIKGLGVDLVHLNTAPSVPCAVGARLAGVPVVWQIREILHDGHLGIRKFLLQQCVHRCADRVVAVCQYTAERLIPSDRVRIIYNFVDFTLFDRRLSGERLRRALGLDGQCRLVGMLGGVLCHKGTLEFLQALPFVKSRVPGVRFLVVGRSTACDSTNWRRAVLEWGGERLLGLRRYDRMVLDYVQQASLQQDVLFTGVRSDIPDVIAALDLVVFPSTVPHFGRPIIEAGAMAKPVVASDLGGPRELVERGVTGFLVPAGDPQALAEAVVTILEDPDLARAMGEAGYAQARRDFDAEKNAAATFQLYDELLESNRRS